MLGVIFHLALHDPTPPPIEVYWTYLVNARRGALEALARAKAQHDPATPQTELDALLKQLEPLRPQFSVGMVSGHDHMGDIEVDVLTMATFLTLNTPKEPTPWPH